MVRDKIRDKLADAFEDLGEQGVKNIARPVRVYAMRPAAVADLPAPCVLPISAISLPAVAPRLSIVLLPFANLSNDPKHEYFADGIADDLTTDLSRISDSFVIARNTAFTYKGKSVASSPSSRSEGVPSSPRSQRASVAGQARTMAVALPRQTMASAARGAPIQLPYKQKIPREPRTRATPNNATRDRRSATLMLSILRQPRDRHQSPNALQGLVAIG
jgi:hypothetical protein